MDRLLQTFSAFVCAVCGFLWGRLDGLLYALIAFMVMDYITGLISAYIRRELSSAVGFTGIAKKVFIMALVAVGHILDTHVIGDGAVFRSAVIGFYLANEGISILENAGKIGLPLPKKLIDVLAQLKNEEEKND
ncbi:MAG: phage holin family protein [Ruminococcus sp.]|nr:phage holin family protein [Ruminococcus sp.]MDE6849553.1 phage holin family protein [Ruminococcus sp.]